LGKKKSPLRIRFLNCPSLPDFQNANDRTHRQGLRCCFDSSIELMGQVNGAKNGHKPGPPSRLQQLSQRLAALPRSKQKVVVQMLEGFLQQAGS
jgi:hypothetical protein